MIESAFLAAKYDWFAIALNFSSFFFHYSSYTIQMANPKEGNIEIFIECNSSIKKKIYIYCRSMGRIE